MQDDILLRQLPLNHRYATVLSTSVLGASMYEYIEAPETEVQ